MKIIADLHLHSRFSRAVSPQMTLPVLAQWGKKKGIDLLGTGDFTHPIWIRELEANLQEVAAGIFTLKDTTSKTRFLLSTEISSIYSQGGRTHKIHTLILAPDFASVAKINAELTRRGVNLFSDGRPITGLSARTVAEIVLTADPKCLLIPAHAWTPHFSVFGAIGGFNSLAECFGDLTDDILAIETGLSSDPAMNWKIEELEGRKIVSFSDAHSPAKLGREATVFDLPELTFANVRKLDVAHTIEFYPEEGKYHYTGHRNCQVVYSPKDARKKGIVCPVCGKTLTVGVASRVEQLGKREIEVKIEKDSLGVAWIKDKGGKHPPYVMLVPLQEIIAEALGVGMGSKKVLEHYEAMIGSLGSEFRILLSTPIADLVTVAGERIAEGIAKVRAGDIVIEPGYDGVFGKVGIWREGEEKEAVSQETLF